MSLTLTPRYRPLGDFRFGSWSWGFLLEVAGPIWPMLSQSGYWYRLLGVDRRFKNPAYPEVLGDSGEHFYVTADEARHLARVARNWALVQQALPEENRGSDRLLEPRPFPWKVRDDWPPLFLEFADWAEKSHGFSK